MKNFLILISILFSVLVYYYKYSVEQNESVIIPGWYIKQPDGWALWKEDALKAVIMAPEQAYKNN